MEKAKRKFIRSKIVEVKIKGEKYKINFKKGKPVFSHDAVFNRKNPGNLVMVSQHPMDKSKVLVWREKKIGNNYGLFAVEGDLKKGKIIENPTLIVDSSAFSGGTEKTSYLNVGHFEVKNFKNKGNSENSFKRKGLGTVVREYFISKAKKDNIKIIKFPGLTEAHYPDFYIPRGLKKQKGESGKTVHYTSKVKDLLGRKMVLDNDIKRRIDSKQKNMEKQGETQNKDRNFIKAKEEVWAEMNRNKESIDWHKILSDKGFKILWAKSGESKK